MNMISTVGISLVAGLVAGALPVSAESRGRAYTLDQLKEMSTVVVEAGVLEIETNANIQVPFPLRAAPVKLIKGQLAMKVFGFHIKDRGFHVIYEQEFNRPSVGQVGTFYLKGKPDDLTLIGYIKKTEPMGGSAKLAALPVAERTKWQSVIEKANLWKQLKRLGGRNHAARPDWHKDYERITQEWTGAVNELISGGIIAKGVPVSEISGLVGGPTASDASKEGTGMFTWDFWADMHVNPALIVKAVDGRFVSHEWVSR